jgi:hypothetical protein
MFIVVRARCSVSKTVLALLLALSILPLFSQQQAKTGDSADLVFQRTQTDSLPEGKIRPIVLPDGRMVLTIGDTVYMVGADGKQLWKYANPYGDTLTSEPAFNAERNEIGLVCQDAYFVRLDAATGNKIWDWAMNGSPFYRSVAPYGKGYLTVIGMEYYRENNLGFGAWKQTDQLRYYGDSQKDIWTIDFPINAELVVNGNKIYAVIHKKDEIQLQELHPPSEKPAHTHSETPRP